MRTARLKADGEGFYHVMSRVVDRRMVIDEPEKVIFRDLMRATEVFSGVNVLTYAILDNHFHVFLHVPEREDVHDEEFLARLGCLYHKKVVTKAEKRLRALREKGAHAEADAFKHRYTYRMYDLSEFMKTLKQRYTEGFNSRHSRKGTLWEERFKSTLVENPAANPAADSDAHSALAFTTAYIDLNPVRAMIVDDPMDYAFSGYGEAMNGGRRAQIGLEMIARLLGRDPHGNTASDEYRQLLYIMGAERGVDADGNPLRRGFSKDDVQAVLDAGGRLTIEQALRCRVRYVNDGAAVGTESFVGRVRACRPACFGRTRRGGPAPMTGAAWGALYTARPLGKRAITVPEVCI
jgi:putative transposase